MATPELAVVGDVGGTHCRVGVANSQHLLDYEIFPTPQDADEFFHELGKRVSRFSDYQGSGTRICAIGMPGPVSRSLEGVIDGISVPGLEEPFSVTERLTEEHPKLRDHSVMLLNDAEAATITAAKLFAKDNNKRPLLYLGVGTGIGSDVSLHYEALSHASELLIELSYVPFLQEDGSYATLGERVNGNSIRQLYGDGVRTAKELYEDPSTQEVWDAVSSDLAHAIVVASPSFGLTQVVIGGGVGANCQNRIKRPLNEELTTAFRSIPPKIAPIPEIDFIPPALEKTIGLHGCRLALQKRQSFS